jgi:hypothetical protein
MLIRGEPQLTPANRGSAPFVVGRSQPRVAAFHGKRCEKLQAKLMDMAGVEAAMGHISSDRPNVRRSAASRARRLARPGLSLRAAHRLQRLVSPSFDNTLGFRQSYQEP